MRYWTDGLVRVPIRKKDKTTNAKGLERWLRS